MNILPLNFLKRFANTQMAVIIISRNNYRDYRKCQFMSITATRAARVLKPFGRWDLLIHQFRVRIVKAKAPDASFRRFSPTIPTVFFLVAKRAVGGVLEEHAHHVVYN